MPHSQALIHTFQRSSLGLRHVATSNRLQLRCSRGRVFFFARHRPAGETPLRLRDGASLATLARFPDLVSRCFVLRAAAHTCARNFFFFFSRHSKFPPEELFIIYHRPMLLHCMRASPRNSPGQKKMKKMKNIKGPI